MHTLFGIIAIIIKKNLLSKIEKLPRGIQGEKSSKDMASSRNLISKKSKKGGSS